MQRQERYFSLIFFAEAKLGWELGASKRRMTMLHECEECGQVAQQDRNECPRCGASLIKTADSIHNFHHLCSDEEAMKILHGHYIFIKEDDEHHMGIATSNFKKKLAED